MDNQNSCQKVTKVLLALLVIAGGVLAQPQIYYVDSELGSDANPGTSLAPFRTAKHAGQSTQTGDSILFRASRRFRLVSDGNPGSLLLSASSLTVGRYGDGADPILDGENAFPAVFLAGNVANLTLEHLTFTNGDGQDCVALGVGDISGLTIRHCHFLRGLNALTSGSSSTGSGNLLSRCFFEDQWNDGIATHGSLALSVSFSRFERIGMRNPGAPNDAVTTHHMSTVELFDCRLEGNYRTVTCTNWNGVNRLVRCYLTIPPGAAWGVTHAQTIPTPGGSTQIENCIVINRAEAPAIVAAMAGEVRCYNTTVVNHSQTGFSSFIGTDGGSGWPSKLEVKNCISRLLHPTGKHFVVQGLGPGDLLATDYNCYFPDRSGMFAFGPASAALTTWQSFWMVVGGSEGNSFSGDPLLANAAGNLASDYRILPGSTCIRSGSDLGSQLVGDFAGRRRPPRAWDLGAWQTPAPSGALIHLPGALFLNSYPLSASLLNEDLCLNTASLAGSSRRLLVTGLSLSLPSTAGFTLRDGPVDTGQLLLSGSPRLAGSLPASPGRDVYLSFQGTSGTVSGYVTYEIQ